MCLIVQQKMILLLLMKSVSKCKLFVSLSMFSKDCNTEKVLVKIDAVTVFKRFGKRTGQSTKFISEKIF